MRELPLSALAAWLAVGASAFAAQGASTPQSSSTPQVSASAFALRTLGHFTTELPIAAELCTDLDGLPGAELLVFAGDGRVRTWSRRGAERAFAAEPFGDLLLADPAHALVQLAHVQDGETRPQLVVVDGTGVHLFAPGPHGAFTAERIDLVTRYKQRLRLDGPTLAPIVQDVNGDGRDDFVLPNGDTLEVWIRAPASTATGGETKPVFTRAAQVKTQVSHTREASAQKLSDVLSARLSIPDLSLEDSNGDGRPDLVVRDGDRRAWHLVRADGAIPETPDVVLDLALFKDTTPAAELATGRTLAGGDTTRLETRDLDGDGIPDHVIAHRRKVWVFPGTKSGPQFTQPTTILKSVDDVTALVLLALDGDERPDLLLMKLQVPSVGAILRGLVSEWTVSVDFAGYRNKDGRSFDTLPAWRSTIEVRLPAILEIARDPEAILKRFEEAAKKFRAPERGDLDGDGKADVTLLAEDKTSLEVWRGADANERTPREDEELWRKLIFDDTNKTWDLERVLAWISGLADEQVARVTGSRAADARFELRKPEEYTLLGLRACDVDGDGSSELLLEYLEVANGGRRVFDLAGVR